MGQIAVQFFFVLSSFLLTYRGLLENAKYWPFPIIDQKSLSSSKDEKDPLSENTDTTNSVEKIVKSNQGITDAIRKRPFSYRWMLFFMRRVFRIYPTYAIILISVAFLPFLHGSYFDYNTFEIIGPKDLLGYLLFQNVNSVFWTIPPEMKFYGLIPCIVGIYGWAEWMDRTLIMNAEEENDPILLSHLRFRICAILALAVITGISYFSALLPIDFLYVFLLGSFVAYLLYTLNVCQLTYPHLKKKYAKLEDPSFISKASRLRFLTRIANVLVWMIFIASILSQPWYLNQIFQTDYWNNATWNEHINGTRIPGTMFAVIVFLLVGYAPTSGFAKIFEWHWFLFLGEISYTLYLTHPIALFLVVKLEILSFDAVIVHIAASCLLAWVTHHLIEKRSVAIGEFFINRLKNSYYRISK